MSLIEYYQGHTYTQSRKKALKSVNGGRGGEKSDEKWSPMNFNRE